MSLHTPLPDTRAIGFPRVSGDEPDGRANALRVLEFSPRERG